MFKKKRIHFVGIGGIGMSALAEILYQKGFNISGSDVTENLLKQRLKKKIKFFNYHKQKNVINADLVVHSSAIKKNNIELKSALKLKIPIFSRAMMLADVMRFKSSITIAGSHGKTTTTSIISSILEHSKLDPTILSGGIINSLKINAKLGKGEWIVAEADESDGSFVTLPSTIGVINNIDYEHVDFYPNIKSLKKSFIEYANKIPFYGFIALGIDDKNVLEVKKKLLAKKTITYGLSSKANFSATNIRTILKNGNFWTKFDLIENLKKRKILKNFNCQLLGKHNVQNILASITVSRGLNISYANIKNALKHFQGVKRRFSILYKTKKNIIIDDYAHHPKEISVTLEALKQITRKKIIAVFEPHRYSRLSEMMNEFMKSLKISDKIFILPVYSAGEKKSKIDSYFFYLKLKKKFKTKSIFFYKNEKIFFDQLLQTMTDGNNIIFLGAGLSSKIANKFCDFFLKNKNV